MKHFQHVFRRPFVMVVIALLVVAIAVPGGGTLAQAGIQDDEFNGISLSGFWSVTNPGNASTIGVSGGTLNINVPSGTSITFSASNQNAPRIIQDASDSDFEVEVKYNSTIHENLMWQIQGVLVEGTVGGETAWLRFDFDSNLAGLNTYIGYIDPEGDLFHVHGPSEVTPTSSAGVPLYMRIKYVKTAGQWTFSIRNGDTGDFVVRHTFIESDETGGPDFVVTGIGPFAGSTGNNPGIQMMVDYFREISPDEPPPDLLFDYFLPIVGK